MEEMARLEQQREQIQREMWVMRAPALWQRSEASGEAEPQREEREAFEKFVALFDKYAEVTRQLECATMMGEDDPWQKRVQVAIERDGEVRRICKQIGRESGVDLESWEFALRRGVLAAGAHLLEGLVDGIGSGHPDQPVLCSCGARMQSQGRKKKRIKTILGDMTFRRSVFVCPVCGQRRFPGDELLDVGKTMFSPGVRRLMARAGQDDAFKEGREDLWEFAAIRVTAKDVERVAEQTGQQIEAWQTEERTAVASGQQQPQAAEPIPMLYVCYDGTGVPVLPWETEGRKGKGPDGRSRTREAKLGCVFTQTTLDEKGRPVRDEASTTFVGAIETSEEFGERIYGEAVRRGLERAQEVQILADGARYNWEIASLHFPGATQTLDLYHASEHLHELIARVTQARGRDRTRLKKRWLALLDEGNIEKIIREARRRLPAGEEKRQAALREIRFFERNASRMRYGERRARGRFVGSGVVEAGCKTVIGKRLKQSGMKWTVRGANAIIALRCCHLSARMEDFYEQRAA